jgi:hypothetical protein
MNFDKQYEDNAKHAAEPMRGDYWHEMFCPVRVVLHVTPDIVVFCEKTKATDPNHWTWDLDHVVKVFKEDFGDRLRYGSEAMKDKFWAWVAPQAHIEFADYYRDNILGAKVSA